VRLSERTAFIDESFHEHPTEGFYVLAAALFDTGAEEARDAMLRLRGHRRTEKLHWHEMDAHDQMVAVTTVARLDATHLVTVGTPVPRRGQERARRMSLRR
jgi:hypothetical protein